MVEINELLPKQNEEKMKLATVTEITGYGTALVTFYGEETQSQKEYSYLASYIPAIDDTVLMSPMAETYIILGRVSLHTDIPVDILTQDELTAILNDYVTNTSLTSALSSYLTSSSAAGTYALIGHTHASYVTTSTLQGTYLGWTGDAIHNTSSNYNEFSHLRATTRFYHSGSTLGFFSTTPATKLGISDFPTSTTTTSTIIGYINQVLALLRRYGLT